jgi:glutathione synthase/RimK-type ligase-like ATP-grasp enzyme
MIVLWGIPGDSTLMLVHQALQGMGCPHFFLDQHDVLETRVSMEVDSAVQGCLSVGQRRLELTEVKALYLRPYETQRIPAVMASGVQSRAGQRALQTEDTLLSWADLMGGFVMNRPRQMAYNASKPFQCLHIRDFGFEIPKTLITTDPARVSEFRKTCGAVIYKSISSVRSVVAQWTPDESDRLDDVIWCPTQFQELIRGVDYRVHVVGEQTFACRIRSSADDYRYASQDGHAVDIEACELPPAIAQSCVDASRFMGLHLSGVDLRQREDGRWYCFEVNPSPAFAYFQKGSGQDIASAVARLLAA